MVELVIPHRRFHRSFLTAADEFLAAGEEDRYANIPDLPRTRASGECASPRPRLCGGCCRSAEMGIDPVLVTCDPDNVGSRRAIEADAGVYEDTREGKRRYWVPTRVAAATG
jgi:hypothetical protein